MTYSSWAVRHCKFQVKGDGLMSTSDRQDADSSQTPPIDYSDRRKWPRFPDQDRSRVWFSTSSRGAQYGQLADIGLGGFSMVVRDSSQLRPDQRVVVGLGEWMIPARVKHIVGNTQSGYRVGMEWVRPESNAVVSILEQYRQEEPASAGDGFEVA